MMNEQILIDSLFEANEYIAGYDNAAAHVFSSKIDRKIRSLIRREIHPLRYRIAGIAAAVIIAFSLTLCVSEEVRAAVFSWVSSLFEGTILYRGTEDTNADISFYTIRDIIPADYVYLEDDAIDLNGAKFEYYLDPEGYYFTLEIFNSDTGRAYQIFPNPEEKIDNITLKNYLADSYCDKQNNSCTYVWQDEYGRLFSLGGHMSEEDLYKLAIMFIEKYE